jgi:hypothetical protein
MQVAGAVLVNGQVATADFMFWSPVAAVRADLAVALTPELAAVIGAGVDGWPGRSVNTETMYVGRTFTAQIDETWKVGAIGVGATLGLRMLIR